MSFLAELIAALIKAFFPIMKESAQDSYTVAVPRTELKERLNNKILNHWGKFCLVFCLCLLSGCFQRTIYVPDGTPVKLAETVKNVKVWVITEDGPKLVTMDLPEGHFVLSDPRNTE